MPSCFSYQLYSSRNHQPLERTLAMLSRHGYREVEGYGGVYDDPAALRRLLDANKLKMPSGHFSIEMMEKERARVLAIAETAGMTVLIIPYLDEAVRPKDRTGWALLGKRLNDLARIYRAEGYAMAWHNHDFEFRALPDGARPHEVIFDNAPLVDWEIDVAWVARAGEDPLSWIRRYASTITLAHIKDSASQGENSDQDGWSDVGSGVLPWAQFLRALHDTKCMHWVVEHDKPADDDRFAKTSISALREMRGVQ